MKHNYAPEISQLDFPELNKDTTVYVGEAMLIQGFSAKQDILHVKQTIDGACYNIPKGMYPKTGEDAKREYFSYINGNSTITRSGWCDPFNGMYVDEKNKNQVCIVTFIGATSCYTGDLEIKK